MIEAVAGKCAGAGLVRLSQEDRLHDDRRKRTGWVRGTRLGWRHITGEKKGKKN
jgi:hypothetical protein